MIDKFLLKKIIRKHLLNEVETNQHFEERINERLPKDRTYDVVFFDIIKRTENYIGEYTIPINDYLMIKKQLKYLFDFVGTNKSYHINFAIKLHRVNLFTNWNTIKFEPYIKEKINTNKLLDYIYGKNMKVKLKDKVTGSSGDSFVAIIKNNKLETIMLMNYYKNEHIQQQLNRHNYEDFTVLNNAYEINKYS